MNEIKQGDLLPEHYQKAAEPYYAGKGAHSVMQLEEICAQYKELVHQLRIRERSILRLSNSKITL